MSCSVVSSETHDLSRRQMRSLVFQLLYAAEAFDYQKPLADIVASFNQDFDASIDPHGEVASITQALISDRAELDERVKPFLINWRFERIGVCTKLILRFAVWELLATDTAISVIINEAIELAKCFSEKDAHKFINGILDKVAKQIRGQ